MSLKILIAQDGEHILNAEVADVQAIPDCLFAASQHYGGGEYVARLGQDDSVLGEKNTKIFSLKTEWHEAD